MARKTYWEGNGRLQVVYDELEKLIPTTGRISGARNRQLERLRKAMKSYYDLFRNGGCNYGRSIGKTFGPILRDHRRLGRRQVGCRWVKVDEYDWDAIIEVVEPIMDQFIINAADEQIPGWEALLL